MEGGQVNFGLENSARAVSLALDESIEADSDLVSGEISKSILTQVEGVNSSISLPVVLLDHINIGPPNARSVILLLLRLVLLVELLLELLPGVRVVGVSQGGHHQHRQQQHLHLLLLPDR